MTLNGEVVPALSNWQAVMLIVGALLATAAWRALRRYLTPVLG